MGVIFGERVAQARKEKGVSREALAEQIGTSAPIVGRYERGDMIPSIEIATKIADALQISLDFLVGRCSQPIKDSEMIDRLEDIVTLPTHKQTELFNVIDAYIRDYKTAKAYKK